MHTLSSASRTCMASASAVEWTATVRIPSSLQARKTRKAISPRLAIRILSNIERDFSFDDHERLAKLDRLTVFDQNLGHCAGAWSRDVVHGLHGFDDEQCLARPHAAADFNEGPGAWLRPHIGRADHGRCDGARMLGRIDRRRAFG